MAQFDCDDVVLGAGVAGLVTARLLAEAGRSVTVLEARAAIGGRIMTQHVADPIAERSIAVELGAEFVHGLPAETWTLLGEGAIQTYELAGSRVRFNRQHLEAFDEQGEDGFAVLESMSAWAAIQPPECDISFAQYLRLNSFPEAVGQRAADYVESFNAADSRIISVAALAKQQRAEDGIQADRLFRVRAGYSELPKLLATRFERAAGTVLLKRHVRQVNWRPGAVTIGGTDDAGREFCLHARRAVITLPLGVLQSGTVEFTPQPAVLTHARRMVMGPVVRLTLVFKSRFWRHLQSSTVGVELNTEMERLSFLFARHQIPGTWWTAMPDGAPTMTAWAGGPNAAALQARAGERADPDAILMQCLAVLEKTLGLPISKLRSLLHSVHAHDWQNDPYARGAYSYVPAGAIDASEKMTEPVEDTLYFAGEHTDVTGHWGTVHGALRSGIRAARQLQSAPSPMNAN